MMASPVLHKCHNKTEKDVNYYTEDEPPKWHKSSHVRPAASLRTFTGQTSGIPVNPVKGVKIEKDVQGPWNKARSEDRVSVDTIIREFEAMASGTTRSLPTLLSMKSANENPENSTLIHIGRNPPDSKNVMASWINTVNGATTDSNDKGDDPSHFKENAFKATQIPVCVSMEAQTDMYGSASGSIASQTNESISVASPTSIHTNMAEVPMSDEIFHTPLIFQNIKIEPEQSCSGEVHVKAMLRRENGDSDRNDKEKKSSPPSDISKQIGEEYHTAFSTRNMTDRLEERLDGITGHIGPSLAPPKKRRRQSPSNRQAPQGTDKIWGMCEKIAFIPSFGTLREARSTSGDLAYCFYNCVVDEEPYLLDSRHHCRYLIERICRKYQEAVEILSWNADCRICTEKLREFLVKM